MLRVRFAMVATVVCIALCSVTLAGPRAGADRDAAVHRAGAVAVSLPGAGEVDGLVLRLVAERIRLLAWLSAVHPPMLGGTGSTITEGPGPLDKTPAEEGGTDPDPEVPNGAGGGYAADRTLRYATIE